MIHFLYEPFFLKPVDPHFQQPLKLLHMFQGPGRETAMVEKVRLFFENNRPRKKQNSPNATCIWNIYLHIWLKIYGKRRQIFQSHEAWRGKMCDLNIFEP